jgi:hypothetical protein
MRVISVDVVTIIPQCNKKKNRNPCIGRCQLLTGTNIYTHTLIKFNYTHTHIQNVSLALKEKMHMPFSRLIKSNMYACIFVWVVPAEIKPTITPF